MGTLPVGCLGVLSRCISLIEQETRGQRLEAVLLRGSAFARFLSYHFGRHHQLADPHQAGNPAATQSYL